MDQLGSFLLKKPADGEKIKRKKKTAGMRAASKNVREWQEKKLILGRRISRI